MVEELYSEQRRLAPMNATARLCSEYNSLTVNQSLLINPFQNQIIQHQRRLSTPSVPEADDDLVGALVRYLGVDLDLAAPVFVEQAVHPDDALFDLLAVAAKADDHLGVIVFVAARRVDLCLNAGAEPGAGWQVDPQLEFRAVLLFTHKAEGALAVDWVEATGFGGKVFEVVAQQRFCFCGGSGVELPCVQPQQVFGVAVEFVDGAPEVGVVHLFGEVQTTAVGLVGVVEVVPGEEEEEDGYCVLPPGPNCPLLRPLSWGEGRRDGHGRR